jgi:hypothetical protein
MALFEKKGDIIDYTYLQKRGIIKKEPEIEKKTIYSKDGFVDLSKMNIEKKENNNFSAFESLSQNSMPITPKTQEVQSSGGFLNFMDSPKTNVSGSDLNDKDINAFKIKIEDLEYKLSNLLDKLSMIEDKLQNFERRVIG